MPGFRLFSTSRARAGAAPAARRPTLAARTRTVGVGVACAVVALAASAVGPAGTLPEPFPLQGIRLLEAVGRGHPAAASAALQSLLPATAEASSERLELLTVDGVTQAIASLDDGADRDAARLDAWGRDPARPLADLAGAAALLIRARILIRSGDLAQAANLLRRATARLPADLPASTRYRFIAAEAFVATEAGRLGDAVRLDLEAVGLADRSDTPWRRSEARTALAYGYLGTHQHERAARSAAEAIALSQQAHDWVSLARAHNIEGIVADALNDRPGQRRAFEAAIDCARRAGSKADEVRYLANLADFFLTTADYPTALRYSELALPLARELHDRNTETVALSNLGLAQISLHQRDAGLRNVLAAVTIDEMRGSVSGVADTWRNAGMYLERAGELAAAVDAYHRYRRLTTEVLRGDQQKAVLALQEQVDADNRTRALALLERDKAIKAEQLHRRALWLWLGGLLALASLLSFFAVALLYRRVRQTNRRLARSNAWLKVQGECDPLTGLANRRHFNAVMGSVAPDGCLRGTAFLIDIDHFKAINDRIGHPAGDAVLVEVARRLRSTLRDEDLLVRWGGEEFLLIARGLGPSQVTALAQRLLGALEDRPVRADADTNPDTDGGTGTGPGMIIGKDIGKRAGDRTGTNAGTNAGAVAGTIAITGSIGFATFPLGAAGVAATCEQAVNLVDAAMYLAKADGRNCACGVLELAGAAGGSLLDGVLADLATAARQGRATLTTLHGQRRAAPPPVPADHVASTLAA